jgi:hypothetical protein
MQSEELKIKLTALLPAATYEEGGEWLTMQVDSGDLAWIGKAIAQ